MKSRWSAESFRAALWPPVNQPALAVKAASYGAYALWFMSSGTVLLAILRDASGEPLQGVFTNDPTTGLAITLAEAVILGVVGYGIWRASRASAAIGLVLAALTAIDKLITSGGGGAVLAVLVVLYAVHGVRCSVAYRRLQLQRGSDGDAAASRG